MSAQQLLKVKYLTVDIALIFVGVETFQNFKHMSKN